MASLSGCCTRGEEDCETNVSVYLFSPRVGLHWLDDLMRTSIWFSKLCNMTQPIETSQSCEGYEGYEAEEGSVSCLLSSLVSVRVCFLQGKALIQEAKE